MAIHRGNTPPVEQHQFVKRIADQPSRHSYWDPVYRGYRVQQDLDYGPLVREHLDSLFVLLRSLQHRYNQSLVFRVDLRFPVDLEDQTLYASNRPICDFVRALKSDLAGLSGKHDPGVYVLWARELNDQSRRRNATDADLQDGEADLAKPHYHLLVAVNRDAFQRLGPLKPSADGDYSDPSLAHAVTRSWQGVLNRPSHRMARLAHVAENPVTKLPVTFTLRRNDGPEALIDVMLAGSYLCKAYSKDTGKRLRTFQPPSIPAEIREAIWKQEGARDEPVRAAECYRAENAGCTTQFALEDVDRMKYWLLQPLLQMCTASSFPDWPLLATEELGDRFHLWTEEMTIKRMARCESEDALMRRLVRRAYRDRARGEAECLTRLLTPARLLHEIARREERMHCRDGTRRVYDPCVTLYRQAFEPLRGRLMDRGDLHISALLRHPEREALFREGIDTFYHWKGQLARTDVREWAGGDARRIDAVADAWVALTDRLFARHRTLRVVYLNLGHDPILFAPDGGLPLAHLQQAWETLWDQPRDSPLFDGLVGLIWKRDHTVVRQHSLHLFAFYATPSSPVAQRRDAIADHWIHGATRGEGTCTTPYPNPHNAQHLLTPSLDWIRDVDQESRRSLRGQLRALARMDRLTCLAYPDGMAPHGTWERDLDT